jgi:hypothetical protein
MTHPLPGTGTTITSMQGVGQPRQLYALLLLLKVHPQHSGRRAPATPLIVTGEQVCAILLERTTIATTTTMGWKMCTAGMERMGMSPVLPALLKDLLTPPL